MAETPDQFRFLETQGDHREPVERRLRAVTDVVRPIDVADTARRFVQLHTTDRRGELREPEAALQNRVLSWMMCGHVSNRSTFAAEFTRAAQEIARGQQLSGEVQRFLSGIEGAVLALRALEQDEQREHLRYPERHQFLGMNAAIDAGHAVDIVDIRYDAGASPTIHSVVLVQAKLGTPSPSELDTILDLHRTYYREKLLPLTALEHREQLRAAESTIRDMESPNESTRQTDLQYLDALLELSQDDAPSVERIAQAAHAAHLPPITLHLFLRQSRSLTYFRRMLKDTGEEQEAIGTGENQWHAIHALALRELPDRSVLRALLPDWKLNPRFLLAHRFTSATYGRGTLVQEQPLDAPGDDPRILTTK